MVESAKDQLGTPKPTTQRLTYMAFAFKQTWTLVTAIQLDLFSKLSEGANKATEIGQVLGLPLEVVDKLVTACTALGLLEKREDGYYNAADVDRYLVRGKPAYYGDFLSLEATGESDLWKQLGMAVRQPQKTTGIYEHLVVGDPNLAYMFTMAGFNSSIAAARKLTREFDFSPYSLYLDLGGGSGCYSIAAVRKHPNLRAIVFDFPNVCPAAEDFIAHAGLSDRITTHAGDFLVDELPKGADVVSLISCLYACTPEETEFAIKKVFNTVTPGGSMICIDYTLNDERTGPLEPALRHLESLAASTKGWVHSKAEMAEYMRRAGFTDIFADEFIPGSLGRIIARKPK